MVNTETGGIDSSIIADAAPDEKGAFFMPTAIISGGIQDFRRTIDQLPNIKLFPDWAIWTSSSGEQLYVVEKISDNANRADWIIYPPSREFQFPDPTGRVAFFAIQYITGRAELVCPPLNEVSSSHREFYRCFFDQLVYRGLLIDPNDSCQSNTEKIRPKRGDKSKKISELLQKFVSDCEIELDEDYKFILDVLTELYTYEKPGSYDYALRFDRYILGEWGVTYCKENRGVTYCKNEWAENCCSETLWGLIRSEEGFCLSRLEEWHVASGYDLLEETEKRLNSAQRAILTEIYLPVIKRHNEFYEKLNLFLDKLQLWVFELQKNKVEDINQDITFFESMSLSINKIIKEKTRAKEKIILNASHPAFRLHAGNQAGGNGAGRKPSTPEEIAAKKKLLKLTEKNRPKCRNYDEAIAKAYDQLDDDEKWLIDTIPAWSTVRGWRNLPDE